MARIAEVALAAPLGETYHYEVPEELAAQAAIGHRVLVPLGPRRVTGYILSFPETSEHALKPIASLLDPEPLFPQEMVPLFRWLAAYYVHPIGLTIKSALPPGLVRESRRLVKPTGLLPPPASQAQAEVLEGIVARGQATVAELCRALGRDVSQLLWRLRESGHVVFGERERREAIRPLVERVVRPVPEASAQLAHRPAAAALLEFVCRQGECRLDELRGRFPEAAAKVRRLSEEGLVEVRERRLYRSPFAEELAEVAPPELNREQEEALTAIRAALGEGSFRPLLLHGVTGSGKTEVYLRAAAEALALGRGVLMLVPEIAVGAQHEAILKARFGSRVALLHSGLSRGERLDEWERARIGAAKVVVGARSAVFCPLEPMGLIIVDEEHEGAYKQDEGLRYSARDVALVRGRLCGAVVVLGSATPSVQSLHHAREGRYGYLRLSERATRVPLPEVEVVDMKEETGLFSARLVELVTETLAAGRQAMLFLNRRGFATYCLCQDCGRPLGCPNCHLSLTYHAAEERLRCHYCDYGVPAPGVCPGCGGTRIKLLGLGSQRVEAEARELWPEARLLRMDSDAMNSRTKCLQALSAIRRGEVDLIVATQMMAKGHDLPGLSLVGVVLAEEALGLPDFRAAERCFQLLAQVAGRAGRTRPGRVIVQAYDPEHYALRAACRHDCAAFFEEEAPLRRELNYPPYSRLCRLVVSATSPQEAAAACQRVAELAHRHFPPAGVLGPAPAPLSKLKGRYRWHLLLRSRPGAGLHRRVQALLEDVFRLRPRPPRLEVDVDPLDML
jgi:primosomal protein N' (replication factor Y)